MFITRYILIFICVLSLAATAAAGSKGGGAILISSSSSDNGGGSKPIDEPGTDMTTGSLYGDLFVILRYLGGETKRVPAVNADGQPRMSEVVYWTDPATGKECTVMQQEWTTATAVGGEPRLTEEFVSYTIVDEETGLPIKNPCTGEYWYPAPYPSQCVQPVANFELWGDIFEKTELLDNRLPLIMIYDATWDRTECEVAPDIFIAAGETWIGNGLTYYTDIYYTDLIEEVSFGRLNQGRAPDAVLNHAFDEAINAINNAKNIVIDASGRLLLTTDVYDEFLTNPDGTPLLIDTVTKAIDSPLENMALYVKLMKDGHLITPASERVPIDRSIEGGIPLWKLLGLEDGPSSALRPTIDIEHVRSFGLHNLVDASNIQNYATHVDAEGNLVVTDTCPDDGTVCEQWYGITARLPNDVCAGDDFPFTASFVSAAADKTGEFNVDKIVYLNSILGINLVVGTSADGTVDYSKNPVYFNFANMNQYQRQNMFTNRGQVVTLPGGGSPATYDGTVRLLVQQTTPGTWVETDLQIFDTVFGSVANPDGEDTDITGFTRMTDDDLRVIEYTHTYQIPGLR